MKRILTMFLVVIVFLCLASFALAQEPQKIYFFYGTGCPHCAQVEKFFEEEKLYEKYPIDKKEIYFNRDNAILFNTLLDKLGISDKNRGVPAVIVGDKVLIGDKPIIENFIPEADKFLEKNDIVAPNTQNAQKEKKIQRPDLTLAAVVVGSLVDAINPCEFAVLIILMTTILASGNARKALKAGLAFSLSIFISYLLMGLGLYKALSLGGVAGGFFKIVGFLAIIIGLLNLKDYFWYGKGFLMEVPLSWRPKMKSLIRGISNPIGGFFIALLVSLFLLPCTAGPYFVILGMLAHKVTFAKALAYLILYNVIFILPMLAIVLLIYYGLSPEKA